MKKAPNISTARSSKSRSAKPRTDPKTPRAASAKSDSRKAVKFLHKPNCTTCRKARAYMEHRGIPLDFRNLDKERLSITELEKLIGPRDHTEFLNTRNELYREKNMKEKPPSR